MNLSSIKEPRIKVSPTLKHSLWVLSQKHMLSWSECMELGVSIKLAEKGDMEYPNTLFKRKFNQMRDLYEEQSKELEKLKPKEKPKTKETKKDDSRKPK